MAALHCIVNLGGSALTDKSQLETLRSESLTRAAHILRRLCASKLRCVLVHGAGSFGHFQAKEFRVAEGSLGAEGVSDTLRHGLCATRLSVTKRSFLVLHVKSSAPTAAFLYIITRVISADIHELNHLVVEALVAHGVPAIGISSVNSWRTAGGKVIATGVSTVREVLNAGYVTVLHGDCVLDSEKHCSVLSGDIIIQILSREFSPRHVVFLMDVDGIYTSPPHTPGAELVCSVSVGVDGQISPHILTIPPSNDVTGGASLKLRAAVAIVTESRGTVEVLMCNIASRAGEEACMTGQLPPGEGTRVTLVS